MSTKLLTPCFGALALFAVGCQEGTTREDVAEARADLEEEKQDVAVAKADANVDVAAEQSIARARARRLRSDLPSDCCASSGLAPTRAFGIALWRGRAPVDV